MVLGSGLIYGNCWKNGEYVLSAPGWVTSEVRQPSQARKSRAMISPIDTGERCMLLRKCRPPEAHWEPLWTSPPPPEVPPA